MTGAAQAGAEDTQRHEGWRASLSLGFARAGARTVLARRRQRGPLAVQRPFHPEGDVCHVYLLHPPGGVVGGDTLDIDVDVAPGARALVTTPGATKFYRSAGPLAMQRQLLSVRAGVLEWFPRENILFPGALVRMETIVRLDGTAHFLGWTLESLGCPAVGERFETGRAVSRVELHREGRPLLMERLEVEGTSDLNAPCGLRSLPVTGTMVATGADDAVVQAARGALGGTTDTCFGITRVGEVLLARYLGSSTERAHELFLALWQAIRPLIHGRAACVPRIWAT